MRPTPAMLLAAVIAAQPIPALAQSRIAADQGRPEGSAIVDRLVPPAGWSSALPRPKPDRVERVITITVLPVGLRQSPPRLPPRVSEARGSEGDLASVSAMRRVQALPRTQPDRAESVVTPVAIPPALRVQATALPPP